MIDFSLPFCIYRRKPKNVCKGYYTCVYTKDNRVFKNKDEFCRSVRCNCVYFTHRMKKLRKKHKKGVI